MNSIVFSRTGGKSPDNRIRLSLTSSQGTSATRAVRSLSTVSESARKTKS
jgi:hypothetical protein